MYFHLLMKQHLMCWSDLLTTLFEKVYFVNLKCVWMMVIVCEIK